MSINKNLINVFRNLKLRNKVPNNFLLIGADPVFSSLVPLLAQIIVCPQNNNCASDCSFCTPIVNKSYEHFLVLEPDNNVIKINDLDALFDWSQYSNDQKQVKIYWIRGAESLTLEASNKLLKFLETDRPHYIGILTTNNPAKLLPTVRSRLQSFFSYNINPSYDDLVTKFQLKPKEVMILKEINLNIYVIDELFIQKKFLPTMELVYLFQTAWEKSTLESLYLWDRKKIIEPFFWFFLELLILFLNQIWWEKKLIDFHADLEELHWLLNFTQKIWERQQEFSTQVIKGGNPFAAFLFWLSELIERKNQKRI